MPRHQDQLLIGHGTNLINRTISKVKAGLSTAKLCDTHMLKYSAMYDLIEAI